MLERITTHLAERIVSENKQREVVAFGLFILFHGLINICTTIIIGCICGKVSEYVIFYFCFVPLRKFMGGFHSKTPLRCYFYSVILVVLSVETACRITLKAWYWIPIGIVMLGCISFLPVEAFNKPLEDREKKVFKLLAIMIFSVEYIVSFCLVISGCINWISSEMIISIMLCEVLVVMGIVERHYDTIQ